MEYARREAGYVGLLAESAEAEAEHHVAYLADRGVGEYLLEFHGDEGLARREEAGERPDEGDRDEVPLGLRDVEEPSPDVEDRGHPGDQVDPRLDHRGSVDEGGDRGRPSHGLGQPLVEWELGGFADGTAEEEDRGQGD